MIRSHGGSCPSIVSAIKSMNSFQRWFFSKEGDFCLSFVMVDEGLNIFFSPPLVYNRHRMTLNRAAGGAIVLFFCVMNVLLLERQLAAPPPPITLAAAGAITEPMDEWWGVYFHGEKIGYSSQKITPEPGGYNVKSASVLRLNILETTQTVASRLEMSADGQWAMKRFDFELDSNHVRFGARGAFAAGKLSLVVDSGGHRTESEIAIRQPPYLLAALKPYIVTQDLEPGKEHIFPTFDPGTLSQQLTSVTIEGRERIRIGGRLEPAVRLRHQFRGISVLSWVDRSGRNLQVGNPTRLFP